MTEQALHKAIVEKPDDDVIRLVYADWLDEDNQPARAELIRIKSSWPGAPDGDERWDELTDHERELLKAHEPGWLALSRAHQHVGVPPRHARRRNECPPVP